jgi:WD40 repeat protein
LVIISRTTGELVVWDIAASAETKIKGLPRVSDGFVLSQNGDILINDDGPAVSVVDLRNGKLRFRRASDGLRAGACVSPDGSLVVLPVSDSAADLLPETGKAERFASFPGKRISCGAFDGTGTIVGFGFSDGAVAVVEVASKRVQTFEQVGHRGEVTALAFSRDGKTMVTGSEDAQVVVWDISTRKKTTTLAGHNLTVTALQFGSKGSEFYSLCAKRGPLKWDTKEWRVSKTYGDLKVGGFSMAVSPDERTLVVAGFRAEIYDTQSGEVSAIIPIPPKNDE